MKISACSIVKNEANNIARSIESYKDVVDEIIIVDTGSTDDTVEICKAKGAKTLFYQWNNDFSAAKNYALEHAKSDWVIFLDADEWFVPKLDRKTIINVLKQIENVADGLMTTMCEYDDKVDRIFAREVTTRIFRNSNNIRFKGSIHESLKDNGSEITQAHCPDIEIFHSGYAKGLIEKKSKRNIEILYSSYNQGSINTSLYFYLFRENYLLSNFDEALKFYELFMEQEDVDKVIRNNDVFVCLYEYMYRIMVKDPNKFMQKDIDNLLDEAYSKYSKLPMHSYLIGCEKMKIPNYKDSYNWISKAIELNREYSQAFSNSFIAFLDDAYYKLGFICQEQGKLDQALSLYLEAIKISKGKELVLILSRLIKIIEDQPQEEIILFLDSILDMTKKESVQAILSALKQTRLHKAFVYYAVKYNQEFDGQDDTTYIAMILMGQAELAVETAIEASNKLKLRDSNTEESLETLKGFTEKGVQSNWHIDYAVIAILYSKRADLYSIYKENFNSKQRVLIEAYLSGKKISNLAEELIYEYKKIHKLAYYILEKESLDGLIVY